MSDRRWMRDAGCKSCLDWSDLVDKLKAQHAKALAQARKDALEEAAKLVRSRAGTFDDLPKDVLPARRVENDMGTCLRLAGAIRALQVADAGTEGTT